MPSVPTMKLLCQAMGEQDRHKRQSMLHKVFHGYNSSSDWPGMAFVDDLLDMYPDAKVILNKRRTTKEWVSSVQSSLAFFSTWRYNLATYWLPICYWHHRMYVGYAQLAERRFGVDDVFTVECYERHNEWVSSVAASRGKEVLEWQPDDGWAPLCKFLNYRVPDEPFPRTNETAEIEKLKQVLMKRGFWAWTGVVGATGVTIAALTYVYRAWG